MMTLANYGIKSNKHKDPVSAKALNKSLQIRTRAESALKQCLKTSHRVLDDKRQDIIDTIEDYYSRVPFDVVIWNKAQVKQCIVDSISSLDYKFNPYKARDAFRIVETMLSNLIYLPWHKEFTKIVTYSGRFRQEVNGPLVGIEDVFKAAGFEQEKQNLHLVLPAKRMPQADGSENVIQVMFDCMLAQVIMSDIITVFESSCKSVKLSYNQLATSSELNCYSWIQSYFCERSHQVTEKACSSIQELMNNITNHLTKQLSPVKTITKNDRSSMAQLSHNNKTSDAKRDSGDSPNLVQRQEQVRKILANRTSDDSSPFKLSDDLLKLPTQVGARDDRGSSANERQTLTGLEGIKFAGNQDIPYHDSDVPQESTIHEVLTSGHLGRQNHQPTRYVPRSRDFDTVDGSNMRSEVYREINRDSSGYPTRVDLPHNDRELLIPRQERSFTSERLGDTRQSNRINNISTYGIRPTNRVQLDAVADTLDDLSHRVNQPRFQQDEPSLFRSPITSHSPQMFAKNSSSRYDHAKYEPRDVDRPSNNRLYWSCNSCTFLNRSTNETCEMCGIRKVL